MNVKFNDKLNTLTRQDYIDFFNSSTEINEFANPVFIIRNRIDIGFNCNQFIKIKSMVENDEI